MRKYTILGSITKIYNICVIQALQAMNISKKVRGALLITMTFTATSVPVRMC